MEKMEKKKISLAMGKVVGIYRILGECSLMKVGKEERMKVLGVMKVIKGYHDKFDETEKYVMEKLKPEDWDEKVELYKTDKSVLAGYFEEVEQALKDDKESMVELEFDALSMETMSDLCGDAVKIAVFMELTDMLCE